MMRMRRRDSNETTPTCRCRVLYLGSSVPQVTKDGLQGIQEPLRELYPAEGAVSARGIDSWLSVWSNGLLLENVDENQKKVTRFFPIESLHYCAAVRYVLVSGGDEGGVPRFLPLDSPFAENSGNNHPPIFACIMRRTTGIKVLECHAFICKSKTPANALVQCCFYSYRDTMYVKSIENKKEGGSAFEPDRATEERAIEIDYTGDLSSVNSEIIPDTPGDSPTLDESSPRTVDGSFAGDENHKVWNGTSRSEETYGEYGGTVRSADSSASIYGESKSRRPRQMIVQSEAPPPPPSESDRESNRGRIRSKSSREEDDAGRMTNGGGMPRPYNGSLPRPMNGHHMPPHQQSKKGKPIKLFNSLAERKPKHARNAAPFMMGHPPRGHMGQPPNPHMMPGPYPGPPMHPMMMPPHMGPHGPYMGPPHGPPSHMGPPHGPPPHMGPPHGPPSHMGHPGGPPSHLGHVPPHMLPPQQPVYGYSNSMPRRPSSRAVEEPIYMPSARPLSPTSSYQPGHFPHERYLMQQYATTGRPGPHPHHHQKSPGKKSKKSKGHPHGELPEEIYGRRGHMNEKAFAQSIRAEQRARSYTSLVGAGAPDPMNVKDREIMQMVQDLDLSGDDLERVDPRPGVYRPVTATIASRHSRTSRR